MIRVIDGLVGIVGHGRFGAALAELIEDVGGRTLALDPHREVPEFRRAESLDDLAARCRVVVPAVPIPRFSRLLHSISPLLTPDHLVLDVCSVKVGPMQAMRESLGSRVPWVGTHPLFGPASLARGERPLRVVLCAADEHPGAADAATEWFERLGCRVDRTSADAHDRSMAHTHALTFFLAKGLLDLGADFFAPALPPSTLGVAKAIRTVQADAGHLLETLHRDNPFAKDARGDLIDALRRIDDVLRSPEPAATTHATDAVRIPDLGAASPELREVRDLIDELDEELVALLDRRGRLARRARKAKNKIGRGVRDPDREELLYAARRSWAEERGLDADRVEAVFRSVVGFSVALQEADE